MLLVEPGLDRQSRSADQCAKGAGQGGGCFRLTTQDQDGNRGGVRRLADLMALHPKLKASLYVVAVAALREGLVSEIHRPVHRLLKKPLSESVRILDWNRLESEVVQLGERVRYLKPEFLEGISETAAT